jgi:hypothetical protein
MKRQFIAFAGSLVMAAAVVAAQGTPPQTPPVSPNQPRTVPETKPGQTADIVLTGCLIQGTGPAVFILDNAKLSANDPAEHAQSYVLASSAEDVNFKGHLNHEVTITGSTMAAVKGAQPPAGKTVEEKDLPQLTAKSLTMVSDRCLSTR